MAEIPPLQVQRMGKKWRIVYAETRNLAVFNSGDPVDEGGFDDIWDGPTKTQDGQLEAMKRLSQVMSGQAVGDPEAENIGN